MKGSFISLLVATVLLVIGTYLFDMIPLSLVAMAVIWFGASLAVIGGALRK